MNRNGKSSLMISILLITGLMAALFPSLPALAWTDRAAATTEDPGHAWTVVFDDPMNTATMNSQNIYVSTDPSGSSRLNGVEASATDSTHALVAPPPGGWVIGTTYYLIVTRDVLTTEGMPLEDAVRMEFTVQTPAPTPTPTLPDSGIKVYLEDQQVIFTVPPQTISGRVMVPMRPIFEAMGATLEWDSANQTATAVKGSTTVITQIGNNIATINAVAQTLDVPPTAINGSTLAPLRFVAEAFGYYVKWDGNSQTAYISAAPFQDAIQKPVVNTPPCQAGDIINYGNYEQDNDFSNGTEPIAWRVLVVEGNKALLLSEKGLDAKPYHEDCYIDVAWETCSLRVWLNQDFYQNAFSSSEQAQIDTFVLQNPDNQKYGTEGGNDTQDRVFLLSIDETERYFSSQEAQQAKPTAYAVAKGVGDYHGWCRWWLRSAGKYSWFAALVWEIGSVDEGGWYVNQDSLAVRPAMWLNL